MNFQPGSWWESSAWRSVVFFWTAARDSGSARSNQRERRVRSTRPSVQLVQRHRSEGLVFGRRARCGRWCGAGAAAARLRGRRSRRWSGARGRPRGLRLLLPQHCRQRDRQDRNRGTHSKKRLIKRLLPQTASSRRRAVSCCLISWEVTVGSTHCQFQRGPEWTDSRRDRRALSASISGSGSAFVAPLLARRAGNRTDLHISTAGAAPAKTSRMPRAMAVRSAST